MLARWGLRTATDAGWGLQLQLQAWPVPNWRIQPQFCSRLFAFSRCLCVVACLFIVDREWERACWVVGRVVHASRRASSPRGCSGGILQALSSMQLQADPAHEHANAENAVWNYHRRTGKAVRGFLPKTPANFGYLGRNPKKRSRKFEKIAATSST